MLASLLSFLLVIVAKVEAVQKDLVFCVLSEQERVKCEVRIIENVPSSWFLVWLFDILRWFCL